MAYSEKVANRIRNLFDGRLGIHEIKMFGGIVFMDRGNMCCGVKDDKIMIRVGPEVAQETLKLPYTEPFRMKGFVFVQPEGFETDENLKKFIGLAMNFTSALPDK